MIILNKKWFLSLALVASVSVMAACGDADETEEENNEDAETQEEEAADDEEAAIDEGAEQPEMPQPDLDGIPDVVAEVNGEDISAEEFETTYLGQFDQAMMQMQMTGEEVDQEQLKQQVAESMIGQELLIQEAENRGYDASEDHINELLEELVLQNGLGSEEEFFTALEEQQGMSEEEVMSLLETQVKVDQLVESESDGIEPTEEELEEAYEQMVAEQEAIAGEDAEIPSFEDVKPEIEQQLMMQKEGEVYEILIDELRQDADVTVNL
ncbi:SurA N-terminal domain-containing protein [Evansella halocellulosilytica]|uniref:SurA N-terminal domain-containing protein n=1 Tax=Evansella halocellulosilytica TaxID=2011013 RepID=UPI00211BEA2B|nr:SurA N-terminal domain-containing protein [Evansella halocellulosilytica]